MPDEWRKPTSRITVLADKEHYVFTALTENAAIPERIIGVDPALMDEIGLAIARAENPATLAEWGETLRRLVIPRDLEGKLFSSSSHLVFTVDQTTARVPWEMMVVPAPLSAAIGGAGTATPSREFLGLSTGYGLTRQLQTRFAPAPAQAGDPRQQLSVLIVADPGMNLPAAREEGIMLSKLFTQYGAEVTLLSDQQATPAGLANLLANRSYDILLFAGHCFYNPEQPEASGWIFDHEGKRVFSARELQRFNTPPFVFSHACESGVTPDERSVANLRIGPCFAEAFFAQGVTNFVCTAWPIRDESALSFTRTFYETMLLEGGPGHINLAMLNARQSIVESDPHTAGAYHHYGNPFFQFRRPPTGIVPTLAAAGQLAPGKAAVNKKADKETTKKITKKIAKKMARKAAEKKLTPG